MMAPELALLCTLILTLFASVVFHRKTATTVSSWISFVGCLSGLVLLMSTLKMDSGYFYSNTILLDGISQILKLIFLVTCLISILLAIFSDEIKQKEKTDLFALFLISTLSMCVLASVNHYLLFLVSMMVIGQGYVFMTACKRSSSLSAEAAIRMFLFEAVIACFLCCGVALLYKFTGTLYINEIREFLIAKAADRVLFIWVSFGFLFIAAITRFFVFPFHFLAPDMIQGAPVTVSIFYSITSVAVGTSLILRVCFQTFGFKVGQGEWSSLEQIDWKTLLGLLATVTMTLGNLVALSQKNLKRMLGYYCVAQAGVILLSLSITKQSGISVELFSLLSYALDVLGVFYILQLVTISDGNEFSQIKGLVWKRPYLSFALIIFLLSLSGLPPFVGFVSRFYVLGEVIKEKHYVLAGFTLMNWIVGLGYVLFVIRNVFAKADSRADSPNKEESKYYTQFVSKVAVFLITVPTIILGVYWDFLMSYIKTSVSGVLW